MSVPLGPLPPTAIPEQMEPAKGVFRRLSLFKGGSTRKSKEKVRTYGRNSARFMVHKLEREEHRMDVTLLTFFVCQDPRMLLSIVGNIFKLWPLYDLWNPNSSFQSPIPAYFVCVCVCKCWRPTYQNWLKSASLKYFPRWNLTLGYYTCDWNFLICSYIEDHFMEWYCRRPPLKLFQFKGYFEISHLDYTLLTRCSDIST